MKKLKKPSIIHGLFVAVIAIAALCVPAYAEQNQTVHTESNSQSSGDSTQTSSSSEVEVDSDHTSTTVNESHSSTSKNNAKLSAQEKKAAQQMKLCAKHQAVINKITGHIADRGQRQLDLFTTIATRVEAFYVKSGETVANYDELVASVNDAKSNAQQTVDAIKSTTVTLKCDGTDPKGVGASFKTALKSEIQALKDYRTAVKNLIVGVKSAQNQTNTTESTNTEGSQQ